ncbi:MAG: hypothetical protein RL318_2104 [Fibrobacterota bacterium]
MKRRLALATICFGLGGCNGFTALENSDEPVTYAITDSADIRSVRSLLNANGLDSLTPTGVASIVKIGTKVVEFSLNLSGKSLDTFHVPSGFSVSGEKVILSLGFNQLRSWPSEISMIPKINSLHLSKNPISNWESSTISNTLEEVSVTSSQLTDFDISLNKFPSLKEVNVGENFLQDLPVQFLSHPTLKVGVYGNRICNPSPALDAFLQRDDRNWRRSQVCSSP